MNAATALSDVSAALVHAGFVVISSHVESHEMGTWLHFEVPSEKEEPAGAEVLRMSGLLHVFRYYSGSTMTISGKLDMSKDTTGARVAAENALQSVLPTAGFEVKSISTSTDGNSTSGTVTVAWSGEQGWDFDLWSVLSSLGLRITSCLEQSHKATGAEVVVFWDLGFETCC